MCESDSPLREGGLILIDPLVIISAAIRMLLPPMPGDLDAAAEPDAVMLLRVVEEPLQRHDPAGAADDAAMQSDRHHPRRLRPLLVQRVEAVLEIGVELVAGVEALD